MITRFQSSLAHIFSTISKKYTLLGALLLVATLSWIAVYATAKSDQLIVRFFDVGQGDAIFLELANGRQILIDGGPDEKVLEKLNKVMPFWDRTIDMMIATHADSDHIAGLVPVMAHYEIGTIIWNGQEAETKVFQEWKKAADSEGTRIMVGKCCMRFTLSDAAFFEILHPINMPGSDPATAGSDPPQLKEQNNSALVIRFVYGDDSFLFAGDIERQAEYEIVQQNFNLASDILKVPHHGSKTSSSELFLEEVNPKIAVISVGRNNSYGHPHEAIVQRLEKYGIKIRRTDREGDIVLKF